MNIWVWSDSDIGFWAMAQVWPCLVTDSPKASETEAHSMGLLPEPQGRCFVNSCTKVCGSRNLNLCRGSFLIPVYSWDLLPSRCQSQSDTFRLSLRSHKFSTTASYGATLHSAWLSVVAWNTCRHQLVQGLHDHLSLLPACHTIRQLLPLPRGVDLCDLSLELPPARGHGTEERSRLCPKGAFDGVQRQNSLCQWSQLRLK